MSGTYTYGLYPFAWDAARRCHAPPAGSACVLDLRPLGEQAKAAQSSGYGLFAWSSSPPGDLVSLGTGYAPTLAIDNAARNELRIKLGLAANPAGATLADAIADVLGALADPSGASMAKPIMPGADGVLELHLAGHSRIWSQAIDVAELLSASPKGRANKIRDVIRADLDIAEALGGAPLLGKVLGAKLLALGFTREEVKQGANGKKSQWDRLMSAAVKAKHGANARPGKPDTVVSETFPNDAASLAASSQDQSWTTPSISLTVVGGVARGANTGNNSWGICGTPVSSADHAAYCDTTSGNGYVGPVSRAAAAGLTGYVATRLGSSNKMWKVVGSVWTTLTGLAVGAGTRFSCQSNGSTQTLGSTGQSPVSVTDTAITGNLRGGLYIYPGASLAADTADNWSLDDGLASSPVAAFSGTPLSGAAPLSVAFTDASTNTPTSWLWERTSDGSTWSTFSTSQNPTASFSAGTWGVRLTATNAGGSDGETKLAYVVVTAPNRKATAGSYGLGMYRGLGL